MQSNIKKINKSFRLFVERHSLLNTYRGTDFDGVLEDITFPLMWCDWNQRRTEVKEGTFNIHVDLFIMIGSCKNKDGASMAAEAEQYAYDVLVHYANNRTLNGFWCDIETTMTAALDDKGIAQGVKVKMVLHFGASQNQTIIPYDN